VKLFLPALRELARILGRQASRLRRLLARRRLAKAETDLGLLGWQQADFEGDAKRHIEQLTDFEREQSRLTNDGAALGLAIRQLEEQREVAQKHFGEARAQLEAERAKVAGPVEELERQLAARRSGRVNFAEPIRALDRELREVNQLYAELVAVEPQTAEIRDKLIRLRERTVAIPNEKSDLRIQQQHAVNEVHALEESLAQGRTAVAVLDERLHARRAEFEEADAVREKEISDRVREKQTVEKEIESLEVAKRNPYRKIGQILADHGIAPMNQPQALEAVQRGRDIVAHLDCDITASLEASAREDRMSLWKSCIVWVGVGVAVIAAIMLAVPR
jgi:chromosome segregation ATPase